MSSTSLRTTKIEHTGPYAPAESISDSDLAPPPDLPGYETIDVLGHGGMGVVYRARQIALKRIVALKMIRGALIDAHQRERFRIEAEAVARLQHPNIVQIHEVGEHAGLPFFSLEYVAGGSLADRLSGTPLPPREAAALLETLARAMEEAHQHGVVHRDLKPANVLMTEDGTPKISDFGLAKQMDQDSAQTQAGQIMGTPSYMAPEQAVGRPELVGPAADIYALGAILYEALTGRPPFKGATPLETLDQLRNAEPVSPSALQPKVPRDLETICMKCLHKEPGRRYASALELADDLRRFVIDEPIRARPVGKVERMWRWCRRNRAVASLTAAVAAVLVISTAVAIGLAAWALTERDNARTQESAAKNAQLDAEREAGNAVTQTGIAKERSQAAAKQAELVLKNMQLILDEIDLKLSQIPGLTETRLSLLESIVKAWDQIDASVRDDEEGSAVPTLMVARQKIATVFLSLGKLDLADREFRKLYDVAKHRITVKKGTDGSRYNMALVCNSLGESSQQVHRDMIRSREYFEEALGFMRDALEHPKPDPKMGSIKTYLVKAGLAEILQNLGVLHLRNGQLQEASRYFEEALAEREQLLEFILTDAGFAAEPEFKRRAAEISLQLALDKSYLSRAEVHFRLGETSAAEKLNVAAVERRRLKFEGNTKDVITKIEYARFTGHLGEFYLLTGRAAEGRPLLEKAVALMSELSSENPKIATLKDYLGYNHYRLGCLLDELGDTKAALAQFQECRKLRAEIGRLSGDSQKRQAQLMLALARCGDVDAASKLAQDLGKSTKADSELQLERARAFVQCSRASRTDEERQSLVNAAYDCLHKALADGYRDPFKLRMELDFKPLRDDPRFGEVLAKAGATLKR